MMIHGIPQLIAYLSTMAPLQPGDVLVTGTPPGGVGMARTPPLWLRSGDRVEIEISRVGILENTVIEEVDAQG